MDHFTSFQREIQALVNLHPKQNNITGQLMEYKQNYEQEYL